MCGFHNSLLKRVYHFDWKFCLKGEKNMNRAILGVFLAILLMACPADAAFFHWNFNTGTLGATHESGGNATLDYFNPETQAATTFDMTGGSIPNPADGPTGYVYFNGNAVGNGFGGLSIDYTGVVPNGGGQYVNNYTLILDIYVPNIDWTALFNTNPIHGNDADWYISPDSKLGIGDLGYSADPVIQANTWHRVAFVRDFTNGTAKYFVDGSLVRSAGPGEGDGRFSLYAEDNPGNDLLILGEGDSSGNYANDIYLSAVYLNDSALGDEVISGLGGVQATGIVVPEPASALAISLAGVILLLRRRHA
jgi:5'-nucleotidase / UDP-sugar diphosphatase